MTDDRPTDPRTPTDDPALDALRAADPAAGADPAAEAAALAAIRATVRERIALEPRLEEAPAAIAPPAPSPRPARRRGWPRLAAAAAVAALGVGVVGVVVGRTTAPTRTVAAPTVGIAEDGGQSAGQAGGQAGNATQLGAPQAMSMAEDAKGASIGWYGGGTVVEPGPDLPDEPGTATGYRLDAGGADPAELAARVAALFGVEGGVREQDGMWMVGSADWTGPVVTVSRFGAMLSWSFNDPAVVACVEPVAEPAVEGETATAASGGSAGAIADPCANGATAPPPSPEEARAEAERLLGELGQGGGTLRWETYADDYAASASAYVEVDGARTPISHWFSFGPEGAVQSASGSVAEVVPIEGYPVLGARSAVLRAQQPGLSSLLSPGYGTVMPMAGVAREEAASDAVASDAVAAEPPAPAPEIDGRPVAQVSVARLIAASATPTVVEWYQPSGEVLLVPAYALELDDGSTWTVVAVADPYLAPLTP